MGFSPRIVPEGDFSAISQLITHVFFQERSDFSNAPAADDQRQRINSKEFITKHIKGGVQISSVPPMALYTLKTIPLKPNIPNNSNETRLSKNTLFQVPTEDIKILLIV